jgi:hypothetical protein
MPAEQHDAPLDKKFKPTRKAIYNLMDQGRRLARIGESGRRLMFCAEWIDEHLARKAVPAVVEPRRNRSVA